jgi:hypothetical protein
VSNKIVSYDVPAPWWWLSLPIGQAVLLAFLLPANQSLWPVLGSFIAISLLSSWRLFSDARPYSLNKVWWLFTLIFLSIVPSMQLVTNLLPWERGDIGPMSMLWANGLLLLCLGVYEGVRVWASRNFVPQPEQAPAPVSVVLIRQFAHLAPAIMLTCGAALIIVGGFKGLFLRSHMESALLTYSTTFQLVFENVLRGTMLWCCIAAIVLYRQHRLGHTTLWLVLIPGLLFNFPSSLPSYLLLCIYLGWALAAGLPFSRGRHTFSLVMLVVFLVIAPIFSISQTPVGEVGDGLGKTGGQMTLVHDFDTWSSLCRSMHYTKQHGTTNGRQLIGVVLFFVPRHVWPSKPDGSGSFLFNELSSSYSILTCTYIAEGYINFGVAGSLVFAALISLLIARYDGWYWRRGGKVRFTLPRLFYFVSFGLLFFVLRGDLMSSFAWLIGFVFLFTLWEALFFWRLQPKEQ